MSQTKTIQSKLEVECSRCKSVSRGDELHIFEDTTGKVTAMLCDKCCPRCDNAPSS